MSKTSLTPTQWIALAEAEQNLGLYDGHGTHPYTDVNDIDGSELAATLWQYAEMNVEQDVDTRDEVIVATAQRVAIALATLAFGPDYVASRA